MNCVTSLIIYICIISLATSSIPYFNAINGKINSVTNVLVSLSNISIIFYDYSAPEIINNETPLRINIESPIYHNKSILIIVKDDNTVATSVELWHQFNQTIMTANRTICPMLGARRRTLSVEISSQSDTTTSVSICVFMVNNFVLKVNDTRLLTINKNNPAYFLVNFQSDLDKVAIKVKSKDDYCMILSIQNAVCPINDNVMNVKYSGVYQTVTREGSMIIQNRRNFENKFFVVFVLNNNDEVCQGKDILNITTTNSIMREKTFTLSLEKVNEDYLFPIFGAIGFFLLFYIVSPVISFIYKHCCATSNLRMEISEEEIINSSATDSEFYGSLDERADMHTLYGGDKKRILSNYNDLEIDRSSSISYNRTIDTENDSFDSVSDVSTDPNIYRLNISIKVSELSKKNSAILNRKYCLYLWYLIIISVFYALPVMQLVINFQQTFDTTGNQDICYYNFRCTRPLSIFTAFNNIISNSGYVLLGILFTFITWRRHSLYNECKLKSNKKDYNLGIPQYYGLFYAMGVSLTMEGIMSACYHICPSRNNFQFDTAYMYILACLCMIKIYQTRHPDINATAHSFFMTMAFFIFIGVVGVVYNKLPFWCIFTILYLLLCIFLTCEVYYMGRWSIDINLPRRIYLIIKNDRWKCCIPVHRNRMIVLVVVNITNVVFALYGAIVQPSNFSSHFLAIFMTNLLLYFFIYIIMKAIHCEPFYHLSIVYVLIAIICWGFSIYCFIKYPTDWQETPAKSREHNKDCIFLNFYDIHDIWHFLSSLSMFFSFMALQNIDDSLFTVERANIPVF